MNGYIFVLNILILNVRWSGSVFESKIKFTSRRSAGVSIHLIDAIIIYDQGAEIGVDGCYYEFDFYNDG